MLTQLSHQQKVPLVICLVVVSVLLTALPNTTSAETNITNSVTVTADGGASESRVSTRTVLNGEVVTDWSTTTSGSISHYEVIQHPSPSASTTATTLTQTDRERLQSLLAQLQVLIALYVTLTTL